MIFKPLNRFVSLRAVRGEKAAQSICVSCTETQSEGLFSVFSGPYLFQLYLWSVDKPVTLYGTFAYTPSLRGILPLPLVGLGAGSGGADSGASFLG